MNEMKIIFLFRDIIDIYYCMRMLKIKLRHNLYMEKRYFKHAATALLREKIYTLKFSYF